MSKTVAVVGLVFQIKDQIGARVFKIYLFDDQYTALGYNRNIIALESNPIIVRVSQCVIGDFRSQSDGRS